MYMRLDMERTHDVRGQTRRNGKGQWARGIVGLRSLDKSPCEKTESERDHMERTGNEGRK